MSLFQFINSQRKAQTLFCRDKFSTFSTQLPLNKHKQSVLTDCEITTPGFDFFCFVCFLEKEEKNISH